MKRKEVLKDVIIYVDYVLQLQALSIKAGYDESAKEEILNLHKEMTEWLDEEVLNDN